MATPTKKMLKTKKNKRFDHRSKTNFFNQITETQLKQQNDGSRTVYLVRL